MLVSIMNCWHRCCSKSQVRSNKLPLTFGNSGLLEFFLQVLLKLYTHISMFKFYNVRPMSPRGRPLDKYLGPRDLPTNLKISSIMIWYCFIGGEHHKLLTYCCLSPKSSQIFRAPLTVGNCGLLWVLFKFFSQSI
jgi:hypothetical protein